LFKFRHQKIVHKSERIVFINQGALGDQLIGLPLLSELRQKAEVFYAGRGLGKKLIEHFLLLQSFDLDKPQQQFSHDIECFKADRVISVGKLDWLNTRQLPVLMLSTLSHERQPLWQQWSLSVLKHSVPPFYFEQRQKSNLNLLIAPGSGSANKNWSIEQFHALSMQLTAHFKHVQVLMGPVEIELGMPERWRQLGNAGRLHLNPNMETLLNLYANASHYLGNDSGLSHLAAVYNLKGVIIFLDSDSKIWSPYGEQLSIVQRPSSLNEVQVQFEASL